MSDVGIHTAQNISIEFKLAGLGERIAAYVIDLLIIVAYLIGMGILIDTLGLNGTGWSWYMTILYAPVFLYHLIFELIMNGQSPGKRQMKIRVMLAEGQPAGIGSYLLRWILSPVDFILSGGVAMTSIILTKKSQRLGDLAAGTIVIKEKKLEDFHKTFIKRELPEDYEPVIPEVKYKLEQSDIEIIQEVLKVRAESYITAPSEALRVKIEDKLGIKSEMGTALFLHTVIKDFDYYHSEMD